MKRAAGPVEDLDVDLIRVDTPASGRPPVPGSDELWLAVIVLLRSAERPGFRTEEGWPGAVDGLPIDRQPLAHLVQPFRLGGWDNTIRVRSDVEQIVAAFADDIDEIVQQRLRGFEVSIIRFEAPGVIHGHAGLPILTGEALGWDVLLGRLGITLVATAETVVPDEVGMLVQQGDNLCCALWCHVAGRSIKPDHDRELAVVAEKLLDLWDGLGMQVGVEVAVLRLVPMEGRGLMVSGLVGTGSR